MTTRAKRKVDEPVCESSEVVVPVKVRQSAGPRLVCGVLTEAERKALGLTES